MSMTRIRILTFALAGVLLAGAGSVLASTIVGTARGDTLRGTPKADKLYGRAGYDKLFGLGGNDQLFGGTGSDRLVGGPGADRLVGDAGRDYLVCGPGRDIAQADKRDKVAKDCEVVRGLPKPPPPPPPPPPPVTTPGEYCGATNQGRIICFSVVTAADGIQTVSEIRVTVQTTCQPSRQLSFTLRLPSVVPIQSDRAFSGTVSRSRYTATVGGAFDAAGKMATGTFTAHVNADRAGVHYECESGSVSWSARTPPPEVTARYGTFCGFTDQGEGLCLDVTGAPKTVANLKLDVTTYCTPPLTFGRSTTIPNPYAIDEDGTFSFTRTASGTPSTGGSFTITHMMEGAFDASGAFATGTLDAHVAYDDPGGQHYECDSQTFNWSAQRQP
jgi:hypothetical protein